MPHGLLLGALLAALLHSAASEHAAWAPELGHAYASTLAQAPAHMPRMAPRFDRTTGPHSGTLAYCMFTGQ